MLQHIFEHYSALWPL